MEEDKTAVVLNDIAGKDSSTQDREAELAMRKFISQFIFRKDKNKKSVIFFYTKRSSGCKNIYIISNRRSKDSSKRYGQKVAVLKEQLRHEFKKKYNNLQKHHITDLMEQENQKYL